MLRNYHVHVTDADGVVARSVQIIGESKIAVTAAAKRFVSPEQKAFIVYPSPFGDYVEAIDFTVKDKQDEVA